MIWKAIKADEEVEKMDTARLIIAAACDRPQINYGFTPESDGLKQNGYLLPEDFETRNQRFWASRTKLAKAR